jgi:hypothetical protein
MSQGAFVVVGGCRGGNFTLSPRKSSHGVVWRNQLVFCSLTETILGHSFSMVQSVAQAAEFELEDGDHFLA